MGHWTSDLTRPKANHASLCRDPAIVDAAEVVRRIYRQQQAIRRARGHRPNRGWHDRPNIAAPVRGVCSS